MNGARVLIVEDEEHLARGLRFNLEAEGYTVETVGDGEAALGLLLGGATDFDVVMIDVMLPGKDGFEVVKELRAAGRYVPVLMLTARGRPEDVLRGFEAGADDYLPKPFELAILLARLNGLLRCDGVIFGNGRQGARPPTGRENIAAVYRNGIGQSGNVKAGQISQLGTRPLGVKEVVNPLPSTGGAVTRSKDAQEGMRAFLEKRPPRWEK